MIGRRLAGAIASWALLAGIVPMGSVLARETPSIKEIFQKYGPNVVAITFTLRPKEAPSGGEGRKVEDAVCGVIVDASGLIVTSGDPFPDPGGDPRTTLAPVEFRVQVRGTRLDAEAVGLDRDLNLAYLRLKSPPAGLRALHFEADARLDAGDEVIIIGLLAKSYDFAPAFYTSLVNAVIEKPRRMFSLSTYLQDLSIGGLVVSRAGLPIGIVGEDVLKEPPGGDRMPSNVLSIFGSLAHGRRVGYPMVFPYSQFSAGLASPPPIDKEEKRSWLGIVMQPLNEDLAEYWKLKVDGGVIISSVLDGSPAEKAGLKPADIIVALQGDPLKITRDEDLADFRRRIERMGAGRSVELTYLRRGESKNITLLLGEAPKTAWTAAEAKEEDMGLTVREITIDDIQGQNLEPATTGVVVSELEQAGPSQIAGLSTDDIIQSVDRRPVTDVDSFTAQMARLREEKPDESVFFVLRQTETLFVRVRTPWK